MRVAVSIIYLVGFLFMSSGVKAQVCSEVCVLEINNSGEDFFFADNNRVIFDSMPPEIGYERFIRLKKEPFAEGEPAVCFIITEVVNDGRVPPRDGHGANFLLLGQVFVSEESLTLSIDTENCQLKAFIGM